MVNFELDEEQVMVRDTVAAFAREEVRPLARPADEEGKIPAAVIEKAWQLGLVRGAIPEAFGGFGDQRSAVTGAVLAEELAWGDLSIALHAMAPRLVAFPIVEMGTDEQRKRYLPAFAGEKFKAGAAAVVEPRFDFDLTALSTMVNADGSGFVLNGTKCLVPLAQEAETILVFAARKPEAGFAGVDGFIVPAKTNGLKVQAREQSMGLKALQTYELELSNLKLGPEARLGGERGANFSRLMSESRVALSAMALGVSRAAFEYARDYAKERKAFGLPIATKQAIAFILADMAIEIDAMRLLTWDAAAHLDKGEDALKESYQAKNYSAEASLKITDNAVQVLGGHGYIREHPVEMWLRNARGFSTFEGMATV